MTSQDLIAGGSKIIESSSLGQWVLNVLLGILVFFWRMTVGKNEARVDALEKKQDEFVNAFNSSKQENERHFATKEDINILREDYKTLTKHMDSRFDNMTNLLQLVLNGRK